MIEKSLKIPRWGIVGLGKIARHFIHDLQLVETAKIGAVASRTLTKAKAFAAEYGVEKAYGSYADLFADPEIDIVYIATPHNSHAEISIQAMKAGKHVLCEKPMGLNQKEVAKIVAIAKKNQVFLMEAFWARFNPSIQSVFELVKNGAIGEVNYVNVDFTYYREDAPDSRMLNMNLGGGSLMDMGVYPCFLAYLILGKPDEILAAARFHETGADIQTSAIFKYKKGMANVMSGFASESDMVAKIYGTKGRIYLNRTWHESESYTIEMGNKKDGNYDSKTINLPTKGKGYTYEILECIDCIQNGQLESKRWSHQNSLDLSGITDEIRQQIGLKYPMEQ
ncbi:MAG: putative dehydrogenase [Saprospiraceae bacterium]